MPFTYQLSEEGLALFNKYHEEQQVKAIGCKRAAAQAIYRKSPAKVAKLGGIINIVRSLDNLEEFVPADVIEAAIKLIGCGTNYFRDIWNYLEVIGMIVFYIGAYLDISNKIL